MGCSESQLLKMRRYIFIFNAKKKLLSTLQTFQNKMQQVPLKNFNFKIMKKIVSTRMLTYRKFSPNFGWGYLHPCCGQGSRMIVNCECLTLYIQTHIFTVNYHTGHSFYHGENSRKLHTWIGSSGIGLDTCICSCLRYFRERRKRRLKER